MRILSLGAGVQSSTVFRMMCAGELPKADHAIFADTQWEPPEVYTQLDRLTEEGKKAGIPVHVVTYGDIRRDALEGYVYNDKSRIGHPFATMPLYTKGWTVKVLRSAAELDFEERLDEDEEDRGIENVNGQMVDIINGEITSAELEMVEMINAKVKEIEQDGMLQRQCTSRYKIRPVAKKIKEILGVNSFAKCKMGSIEQYMGISADETRRVRTSDIKAIKFFYPLIFENSTSDNPMIWKRPGITREDCLNWNKKNGFPVPPRSACIGCPYHNNDEWRRIKADPVQWDDAVAFDKAIRKHPIKGECFLHNSRIPLDEVDLEKSDQLQMEMECEGMCGF